MGRGLRRASWSEGGGCGGAADFSFGERPGSNGGSAGRWLLPFPGNGPGTGGVFLGRRGRAAAGRRASLSGRERVRTDALRGGGCCRSPETARVPAACFFVGGNRLRRGGGLLFRGGAGFGRVTHRLRYSPPLFVAITRRLPPPAACHHPPPAITRRPLPPPPLLVTPVAVCLPAAVAFPLPVITRRPLPPPPLLVTPVAVCLPAAVAFPLPVITRRPLPPLLTASSQPASPLSVAFPRLSLLPAARRYRPPPASFLLPLPVIIRCCLHPRRYRPPLPPAATVACHPRYSPQSATTRCLPFPPPCAGRADRWAAAAPRVVGRGAMRRRREVLRNNLENRKILPIFVSVKYRGSGLSRPGFLFFIGLSFLWQKRLSI